MKNSHKIIFVTLLLVALLLRTYRLAERPLGLTWDEAALGYNAYSLLQTGRDEYGQILPIVFKSFGDYKPGLYIYLTTVPTMFGLNEFTTRLPSAISGTVLLSAVYLLTRYLFSARVAICAAFILAINPWAIHFSRGAWEANVALLFSVVAIVLYLRKYCTTAFFFFGLTLLTYHGAKLATPLILLSLLLVQRPKTKNLIIPLLVFLVTIIPVAIGFSSQSGRFEVYSVFSYTRRAETIAEIKRQDGPTQSAVFPLFHTEGLDQLRGVVQRYTNHLSPKFLFFAGDWSNVRHSLPYYGYFHLPELVTMVVGVALLLRTFAARTKLLALWLLLGPIPAALSRDIVSGVRSLGLVIPLVILSGIGLAHKKVWLLLPVFAYFMLSYADLYYVHMPQYAAADWLSAYKSTIQTVAQLEPSFDQIIFTTKLGQPYIFYLYYNRVSPKAFQPQHVFVPGPNGDVGNVTSFGKYRFIPIDWSAQRHLPRTLLVGDSIDLPDTTGMLTQIDYPNGKPAFRLIGNP